MSSAIKDLPLAAEFAPAGYDDWRKLALGVLKGAPFEKLQGKTPDGLPLEPIYPRAINALPVAGRPLGAPWQIVQRVDHPDAAEANKQALHDLENGATGLALVFAGSVGGRGFGLPPTREAIEKALQDVHLDAGIGIELQFAPESCDVVRHLVELIKRRGTDPAACDIRFGIDPIGARAVRGSSPTDWSEIARGIAEVARNLCAAGFKGPFLAADGRVVHDAGGSEAQELAYVLASAIAYLRALEAAAVPLDQARGMIFARLSADADQFLTLAKFRALRVLWARIEQSCGLAPKPLFVAAETAWRMLTQRDPSVNMLRATVATFSAALGGANALAVLPHTLALGLPDALARRIARNTQLVLLEESNLEKVADPAAGSGGIEALTHELCDAAWTQFQAIEQAGGVFAALAANLIQPKIAATRAVRDKAIAKRRDVLTGASEFPNLHEARATVLDAEPIAVPTFGEAKISFEPLTPLRLATPFEVLRDKSDAVLARKAARPQMFLANLGTPADFTARATFAKSFFETGGIEAIDTEGFTDPAALAAAFKASGAVFACLCSSDKAYAAHAAAAAQALREAGCGRIYLAGRPGELEASLREAGVHDFIFAGGDALAMLNDAWQRIEAA
ncbi:Methylmalonyl-CoA mutase [Rhodopseudomonas palustris HaA2]|uniref:methylmalonyl-CoA mutase n=1 Tax=Rhodopseudomonas palustris (strain HaA2) TaxID=316058 RepID=Q2IU79_RHOP2|nr:methylmalonyl-CoA mutase subunit beta [Rhodopseudomonas palustris]ABD08231.1 Methylmalonyl-CoA mutase [Rhodopseudomonas palustris HaA2]